MENEERAFFNKDVARILGIGDSTVRKWCLELEKNGYNFVRGHKESRAFLQLDITALNYFQNLTKEGSYSLEQAAKIVVERFKDRRDSDIAASVPSNSERSPSVAETYLKQLVELQKEQIEQNRELLQKLSERDKIIEEQMRYISRMNEQAAAIEQENAQQLLVTHEDDSGKKKRLTERIRSLFKK